MSTKAKQKNRISDALFFYRSGLVFLRKCVKPSPMECKKLFMANFMGVTLIGMLGYLVKLIHIPINNVIVKK